MYARDISKKVKNAKCQRAKQGLFIGSQTPYGYRKDAADKNQLIIDPEAAQVVRTIYHLAESGLGSVAIASELQAHGIATPAVYKYMNGDKRFSRYPSISKSTPCDWRASTVGQILRNPVYTGRLVSLKTEVSNCKTKQRIAVPETQQIVTPNAHEAIISMELFEKVREVIATHRCPAKSNRSNLFRGKLFCEGCGHPLMISRKQLKYREDDIYLCMYHYHHPDICSKPHRIYHKMLYPYVLQQIQTFAKSMKRRKINSPIEIGHVTRKSRPGNVIHIYWKLR